MKTFSIVIPFFNGYGHFVRCFASIQSQTIQDFELIIVDDCSDQHQRESLNQLIGGNATVKCIETKENSGGPALPRLLGARAAIGKYLLFIDADDWLEDNTLELLKGAIEADSAPDILLFGHRTIEVAKDVVLEKDRFKQLADRLTGKELFRAICTGRVGTTLWGKAIKTELWRKADLRELPNNTHEDLYYALVLGMLSEGCSVVKHTLYNYYRNEQSISENPNDKSINSLFESSQLLLDWLAAHHAKPDVYPEMRSLIIERIFRSTYWEVNKKSSAYSDDQLIRLYQGLIGFIYKNGIALAEVFNIEYGLKLLQMIASKAAMRHLTIQLPLHDPDMNFLEELKGDLKKAEIHLQEQARLEGKIAKLKNKVASLKHQATLSYQLRKLFGLAKRHSK